MAIIIYIINLHLNLHATATLNQKLSNQILKYAQLIILVISHCTLSGGTFQMWCIKTIQRRAETLDNGRNIMTPLKEYNMKYAYPLIVEY